MRAIRSPLFAALCLVAAPAGLAAGEPEWPFHADKLMPDETVLFSSDVNPRSAALLFKPTRIRSVISADGTKTFEEGRDYTVDLGRGVLSLPAGSRIPCPLLYGGEGKDYGRFRNREGKPMLFGEGDLFHGLQVRIAYDHAGDEWAGKPFVPQNRAAMFPELHWIRKAKGELRLALCGDSISAGYNASAFVGAKPNSPPYGEQVAAALREGGGVEFRNSSQAGATGGWGVNQLKQLNGFNPHLVMIAFGMNDGRKPGKSDAYEKNIRAIVDGLRQHNPKVEIVLVANMLPNEEFSPHSGHFENRDVLIRIAGETERVAVADVMSVTQAMLERKKFADICGNHVNHPNDFIHRLYASVILRTLGVE
jgi:lysophospholipase L1-like esterase